MHAPLLYIFLNPALGLDGLYFVSNLHRDPIPPEPFTTLYGYLRVEIDWT